MRSVRSCESARTTRQTGTAYGAFEVSARIAWSPASAMASSSTRSSESWNSMRCAAPSAKNSVFVVLSEVIANAPCTVSAVDQRQRAAFVGEVAQQIQRSRVAGQLGRDKAAQLDGFLALGR